MTDSAPDTLGTERGRLASLVGLIASLGASAGCGVLLGYSLLASRSLPTLRGLRWTVIAILLAWFILAIPLTLAVFVRREAILRMPESRLRMIAWLAFLGTVGAFATWFVVSASLYRPAH